MFTNCVAPIVRNGRNCCQGQRLRRAINALSSGSSANNSRNMSLKYCLNIEDLNPNIKVMEYAVRGPLVMRAQEIEKDLENGIKKPFTEVVRANNGDCHALGQVPITYIRQVLALVTYSPLFDSPRFPDDIKAKARAILKGCSGCSVGSYTESAGIQVVRRHVAEYIEKRDGIPCDPENIVLSAGATDGIRNILKLFNCTINGKKPGIMIPIPQYPLYSATLAEFGMPQIGYYLDESKNWELDIKELQRSIDEARKTCNPTAIVVINPGNPTGQVLSPKNIADIIKFAYKERLFLLADEVYQHNVYAEGSEFHSFKKVMTEMGSPYSEMEIASFFSSSKGYMGECGIRAGCVEVLNMLPDVKANYLKSISAMLCPTAQGQAVLDAVVNPPVEGDESYPLFLEEKTKQLESLKLRAKMVAETLNSFEGFTCNPIQGAMYGFPQIKLPPKAIKAAEKVNQKPDEFYCFQLLENTGICVIPGSGFGQQPGTFHFRTTILPQVDKLKAMLQKFDAFHKDFVKKYS